MCTLINVCIIILIIITTNALLLNKSQQLQKKISEKHFTCLRPRNAEKSYMLTTLPAQKKEMFRKIKEKPRQNTFWQRKWSNSCPQQMQLLPTRRVYLLGNSVLMDRKIELHQIFWISITPPTFWTVCRNKAPTFYTLKPGNKRQRPQPHKFRTKEQVSNRWFYSSKSVTYLYFSSIKFTVNF